ncbi:MAG: hypothetical protein ACKVWR_15840 [Acidimicrobiales bacterium]
MDNEQQVLRELAEIRSAEGALVSLHLDTDGRRRPRLSDLESAAAGALRELEHEVDLHPPGDRAAANDAVAHVRASLEERLDHAGHGLALFAWPEGLLRRVELPRATPDRTTIGPAAELRPLAAQAFDDRALAVLVDRAGARLAPFAAGRLGKEERLDDELPRRVDDDDGGGRAGGFARQIDEAAERHLRRVAAATSDMAAKHNARVVLCAGPDEAVAELTRLLSANAAPGLRRVRLAADAPRSEIELAVAATVDELERERIAALSEQLHAESEAGRAALGLAAILRLLNERRAAQVLIERSYAHEGVHCWGCGWLGLRGEVCPACSRPLGPVADVAPLLVATAIAQHTQVDEAPPDAPIHLGALARW